MGWTRMNDSAPKGLSKVTESKDLSDSSWEDTGSGQEVRTWEIPCQSMTVLSIAAEMAVSNLSCKHGSSFWWRMCFSLSTLLLASGITSHVAFGQVLEDAALDASGCELPRDCRSTLYGLCWGTCQTTYPHPSPGSSRPCLLCVGPLARGLSLLPAIWKEAIFSSPWVPSLPPSAWALLPIRHSSTGYQHCE